MSVPAFHVSSFGELLGFTGVHLQLPVLCGLDDLPEFSANLPQRAKSRATVRASSRSVHASSNSACIALSSNNSDTGLSNLAWHHLLCGPQECAGEKGRFFSDCTPEFGLRKLTGYKLYQPFASSVGVRRDCSSINTLAPCGGPLFSITSESAAESDYGAHDVVVGIRTRLQVNIDVSDKLAVWSSRDDVVETFSIRGPSIVECTKRASLEDGEERVDEGKLVVTREPQKARFRCCPRPGCPSHMLQLLYNPPLLFVHQF